MVRGFVTGVIWGGVVAAAGLAVISQVAPLPEGRPVAEVVPPAAEVPTEAESKVPEAPPVAPEPEERPEILQKGPELEAVPAEESAAAAPVAEAEPALAPAAEVGNAAEAIDSEMELTKTPPTVPTTAAPSAPAVPDVGAADAPVAMAAAKPGVASPPAPPLVPVGEAAPAPQEAPPPAVEAPAEEALLTPEAAPEAEGAPALITPVEPGDGDAPPAQGAGLEPEGTLGDQTAGVTTDRLPRIGDAAPEAAVADLAVTGATPLDLFARPFENAEGRPLFALLLIDEGADAVLRAEVAKLPFPVTFVLDPLKPESAVAAMAYRSAGQEVAMLASGLPAGATAMDMEQTFQALDLALPEAVAVVDAPQGGFQESLDLARQAVPIVADQGRGLVTYDRGLNPADQVARREGVPAAVIFRILDGEGESVPKMRNYLDRAAFKAAQEGKVVVIGRLRPDTVAALLEWSVEGRAASVALAPLSAVLDRPANN